MTSNLTARFHTALDLMAAGQHDQASEICAECVAADPADFEFADAFLMCLEHKLAGTSPAEENGDGSSDVLQRARQAKQLDVIRREGPAFLLSQPHDVATLRALAQASAAAGDYDIELRYLKFAAHVSPQGVELNRHRARSLMRYGKFDDALACWARVQDAAPDDAEAATMLAQLTIEQSRQRHGLEASDSRTLAALVQPQAVDTEPGLKPIVYQDERMVREVLRQADANKRTPVQQLEVALRDQTSNPDLYLKLASLYMEKGREYDAEKLLGKAKELCDDPRVAEYWEDVTMVRLDRKLAAAEKHVEVDDSQPSQTAVADARKARDRFQTEVFLNRCKREPENPALRFELGLRQKRAGKTREAYECFVAALSDEPHKALAACEMAECLAQSGKVVDALQYYRIAAETAQPDQLECKKRALYQASALAAGMRLRRLARRYLERLQRIDPEHAEGAELLALLAP